MKLPWVRLAEETEKKINSWHHICRSPMQKFFKCIAFLATLEKPKNYWSLSADSSLKVWVTSRTFHVQNTILMMVGLSDWKLSIKSYAPGECRRLEAKNYLLAGNFHPGNWPVNHKKLSSKQQSRKKNRNVKWRQYPKWNNRSSNNKLITKQQELV